MDKQTTESRINCPDCGTEFIRFEKNGEKLDGDPAECRECGAALRLRVEGSEMWIERDPEG